MTRAQAWAMFAAAAIQRAVVTTTESSAVKADKMLAEYDRRFIHEDSCSRLTSADPNPACDCRLAKRRAEPSTGPQMVGYGCDF